jgi:hypothetical protein
VKLRVILFGLILLTFSIPVFAKDFSQGTEFIIAEIDLQGVEKIRDDFYVAWLDSSPRMPQLKARLKPEGIQGEVSWTLKIEYRRDPRNDESPRFTKKLSANEIWNINESLGTQFWGGKATLTCEFVGRNITDEFVFYIRGTNPSPPDAERALGNNPWYAKAIARQESGIQNNRTYLQFNEIGTLGPSWGDYRFCPNFGAPNGWGMMQFDNPPAEVNEIWNWNIMVSSSLTRMQGHRIEAQDYFDAIKRTYPDEWVEPPASITISKTSITAIDAAAIQCYNGCKVVRYLWTGRYDNKGNKIKMYYRSSWAFYPNNPNFQRWQFLDNQNNYVREVLEEYEKNG